MESLLIDTETFRLTQGEFILRLLVAMGIGAVIGLERQHAAFLEKVTGFAGIRSFVFVTLLGFMAGLTYFLLSPWVYLGILISVAILTGVSYWVTATKGDIGSTTEFSVLISFVLGTLAFLGIIELSLMIMVLVVVFLSSKFRFIRIIGKITPDELYAFIRFVVIALLVFPFLPDQTFGPYQVLNPREVGWVIILTSGLGFLGYILIKFLGAQKGILLSGILGGLVSSTATTWIFAKKSKESPRYSSSCSVAIMASSSIMILRVMLWTFVFNKGLFNDLYLEFFLVFLSGFGMTIFYFFKQKEKKQVKTELPEGKPLDIPGALMFGLIYVAILLIVSYANENLGERGILISSAIAGLTDIDAITITVSKLADLKLDYSIAFVALLISSISNTIFKFAIGAWAGSSALRKDLFWGYGAFFLAALLVLVFR
ncbi:MgtC/SapB family protein [Algoriphagus sp. CAU 1675]|uniref:MgtC/SapB family protein n=1 Tax=Algoriphagus sp. CAU 1675 TaxID=3032597 RepID=UPI0023DA7EAF|nr:MgtC/SapB family protein [Algoriphagus sp. CAU 1675]MDF2157093.1 MgtC/SapB family protein [Algoriphagus sp. CAU 1675]